MNTLGHAARARRLYHHVLNGGSLSANDVSSMVRTIETLEQQLADMTTSRWILVLVGDGEIEVQFASTEEEAQKMVISDLFENYQEYPDIPTDYGDASQWISDQDLDLVWTIQEMP